MDGNEWFYWALASTVLYGFRSHLYKKVVRDGCHPAVLQVIFPATVALTTIPAILLDDKSLGQNFVLLIVLSAIQGAFFFFTTMGKLDALSTGIPTHVLFPIIKTGAPLTILISIIAFKEWGYFSDPLRIIGVILTVITALLLIQPGKKGAVDRRGIAFTLTAMLASTGAALVSKIFFLMEGEDVSIFGFMLISNITGTLLATMRLGVSGGKATAAQFFGALKWAVIMGLLNFAGFAAYLQAVKFGELSIITSINTLYILIPVLLSAWLYNETLTRRKLIAVIVSIVAIILVK